jgi:wyosine [tRNA(Phe)-imidazoG37] synthetase (radical SAM superfamily)
MLPPDLTPFWHPSSPCRPLFSDYWERFVQCLTALRDKQQRTVYRLTLVRGMNMTGVDEYASLIDLGQPDVSTCVFTSI